VDTDGKIIKEAKTLSRNLVFFLVSNIGKTMVYENVKLKPSGYSYTRTTLKEFGNIDVTGRN